MNNETQIQPDSQVSMFFELSLEDGTVADKTENNQPLSFTMGDGTLIEGLEMALYGLAKGDKQTVEIESQDAFGFRSEDNIHMMPRTDFDESMQLEPGVIIEFETPAGDAVAGAILEVGDEQVKVDFNHPLAGHTVTFTVEIVDVEPASS